MKLCGFLFIIALIAFTNVEGKKRKRWDANLTEIGMDSPQAADFKDCVAKHCAEIVQECLKSPVCKVEQESLLQQREDLQPCEEGYMGHSYDTCVRGRELLQGNLRCWQQNCYDSFAGSLPSALEEILFDFDVDGDDLLSKREVYDGTIKFLKINDKRDMQLIHEAVEKVWYDMDNLDGTDEEVMEVHAHFAATGLHASLVFRNNLLNKVIKKIGKKPKAKTQKQKKKEKREANKRRKQELRKKQKKKRRSKKDL